MTFPFHHWLMHDMQLLFTLQNYIHISFLVISGVGVGRVRPVSGRVVLFWWELILADCAHQVDIVAMCKLVCGSVRVYLSYLSGIDL